MTKFEEKRERCIGLDRAYNAVSDERDLLGYRKGDIILRPKDEYVSIQWDTLTEVMEAIEKML